MKKVTLIFPATIGLKKEKILKNQVKDFCVKNIYDFEVVKDNSNSIKQTQMKIEHDPQLLAIAQSITSGLSAMQLKDLGDLSETIVGEKKIRQYIMGNRKTNQHSYFVDDTRQIGDIGNVNNWARKKTVDPDNVTRNTSGFVILTEGVHLNQNFSCLNPEKSERERIYLVKDSPKPYRKFDGNYNRHCSKCPFTEGCVVCTLP
ncbi:MAG: hypothetical protein KGI58_00815 [Patescibacteria group bacterium]|nr:hypothetical protein [Patescibacteria group bacterium]